MGGIIMKKLSLTLVCVFLTLILASCSGEDSPKKVELSKEDYVYIDQVYKSLDDWDLTIYDSGERVPVQKIAFFDFDGTNKMSFFVTYSIMSKHRGFFVTESSFEEIEYSIYDHDISTRFDGWTAQLMAEGTKWDYTATDDEKYETIKNAYIYFLQNNIYADD
jgi:hypothetical protein